MSERFVGGALLAAAAAGPLVIASLLIGSMASAPADFVATNIAALPFLFVLALLFGFPVAGVPAIAAAALLARLGRDRRRARHPLLWAASGLAVGTTVWTVLSARWDTDNLMFGIVGALCALLARWRTRWSE